VSLDTLPDLFDGTGPVRPELVRVAMDDLAARVQSGELSRAEGQRVRDWMTWRARTGSTRGMEASAREALARLRADLGRKVQAGELSRAQAEAQYRAALERARARR
jgi:hypothetical protein